MTGPGCKKAGDAVREMRVVVAPHEDHLDLKPMLTIRHDARTISTEAASRLFRAIPCLK